MIELSLVGGSSEVGVAINSYIRQLSIYSRPNIISIRLGGNYITTITEDGFPIYLYNQYLVPNHIISNILCKTITDSQKEKYLSGNNNTKILLTKKQLKRKYIPESVSQAMEFSQYGKKKQRKKVMNQLSKKKYKGDKIADILIDIFDYKYPKDLFRLFEFMDHGWPNAK